MKIIPTNCKISYFTTDNKVVKIIYHTTPLDKFTLEQIKWLEEHESGFEGEFPYVVEPKSFQEEKLVSTIVDFINSLGK